MIHHVKIICEDCIEIEPVSFYDAVKNSTKLCDMYTMIKNRLSQEKNELPHVNGYEYITMRIILANEV